MNNHTPGPWEVEDHRDSGDWRSAGNIFAKRGDFQYFSGRHVATINWDKIGAASEPSLIAEVEANSRLVAAAPDLLFALEEAMWIVINHGHMPEHLIASELELMRQAIAKAKGEL